jgi:hypothetical protein
LDFTDSRIFEIILDEIKRENKNGFPIDPMSNPFSIINKKKKRPTNMGEFLGEEKRFRMSDKLHDNSDFGEANERSYTLYDDDEYENEAGGGDFGAQIASNLGIRKLDLAPDVDPDAQHETAEAEENEGALMRRQVHASLARQSQQQHEAVMHFDKRKRYVKEAWPGRETATGAAPNRLSRSPPPPPSEDFHAHTKRSVSPVRVVAAAAAVTLFMPEKPTAKATHNQASSNPPKRLII